MRLIYLTVLAVWLALPSVALAASVVVPDLYKADVVTTDRNESTRQAALRQVFAKVLVKAMGSDGVLQAPQSGLLLDRAQALVTLYRFEPIVAPPPAPPAPIGDSTPDAEARPTEPRPTEYRFIAEFDPRAVQMLLRDAGFAPWPPRRPLTLVWLTLDRGEIVSGEAREQIQAFVSEAARMGLPVVFPSMDLADQQAIQPADIQGLFTDQIMQASGRYDPAKVLVGRIERGGSLWSARWALLDSGRQYRSWQETDSSLDALLATGAQTLGQRLLAQYGIGGGTVEGADNRVELAVTGVRSVDDYGRVLNFLTDLPPVSGVALVQAGSGRLVYRLHTTASREQLRQSIELGRVLVADDYATPTDLLGPGGPMNYSLNR